jgi:hypothetical protein
MVVSPTGDPESRIRLPIATGTAHHPNTPCREEATTVAFVGSMMCIQSELAHRQWRYRLFPTGKEASGK